MATNDQRREPTTREPLSRYLDEQLELVRKLASGGMAEVWEARLHGEGGFDKRLAVKMPLAHLERTADFVQLFLNEGKLAAALTHPNICQIFKLGQAQGRHYIAMEYVDGLNLDDLLQQAASRQVFLPLRHSCRVIMEVCAALDYAHDLTDSRGRQLRLIHRDLSPSNVMLTWEGHVKVVDFGIAKPLTAMTTASSKHTRGKYGYLSPEFVLDDPIDHRCDIFAIGIILWELLTGRRLFHGESELAKMNKISEGAYPRPSQYRANLPAALEDIVMHALAFKPSHRYKTAGHMQEALAGFLRDQGWLTTPKKLAAYVQALMNDEPLPREEPHVPKSTPQVPPLPQPKRTPSTQEHVDFPALDSVSQDLGELAGKRLLIVDPNRELLDVLQLRLERYNITVQATTTGQAALAMAKEDTFDACLLEFEGCELSGKRLLKELRQARPSLPCIIHTSNGSLAVAAELGRLGAFSYLLKPISIKHLLLTLKDAFSHLPQAEELEQLITSHYPTTLGQLRHNQLRYSDADPERVHQLLARQFCFIGHWLSSLSLACYINDGAFDVALNAGLRALLSRPTTLDDCFSNLQHIGEAYRHARMTGLATELRDLMLPTRWSHPDLLFLAEKLSHHIPALPQHPQEQELYPLELLLHYYRTQWRSPSKALSLTRINHILQALLSWLLSHLHPLAGLAMTKVDEVKPTEEGYHHNLLHYKGVPPQPTAWVAPAPLPAGQLFLCRQDLTPMFSLSPLVIAGPCPRCRHKGIAFPVQLTPQGPWFYRFLYCQHLRRIDDVTKRPEAGRLAMIWGAMPEARSFATSDS